MSLRKFTKTIALSFMLLNLCGCNQLGVKKNSENEVKPDLRELQKSAEEAYLNDDLETSERGYLTLVTELPGIPEHWFRLANIYVRTNRPVAAIDLYREAVLRDPKFAKAWFNLSIVQLKQSAYTLSEMLIYVDKNEPLYPEAKELLNGIQAIIQKN